MVKISKNEKLKGEDFWFSAHFKTSPIILGKKLWPVRRKYEINLGLKVVEIFNPRNEGQGNLVSQLVFRYRYYILQKYPFSSFRGLGPIRVDLGLQKKSKKLK